MKGKGGMKMFRKLFTLTMAVWMMLMGVPAMASAFETFEPEVPKEPVEIDAEKVHIVAEYDAETGRSRYTLTLKEGAQFADGTPVTAQDLLFTYYTYLDPGYAGTVALAEQPIEGLNSYRFQCTDEQLSGALETMQAIQEAGADHEWSASDPWSEELQQTYWTLRADYDAACEAQYPVLAQMLVDFATANLEQSSGAFGMSAEEIAADDRLKVAYAMVSLGYAYYEDGDLTTNRSRTVWRMSDSIVPDLDDFIEELKVIFDGDFLLCWSTVCPDSSIQPELPDLEDDFIRAAVGETDEPVTSISGVVLLDEQTLQVDLSAMDVGSSGALFGIPVLSLEAAGDAQQWDPDSGLYGHPFGDVSGVDTQGGVTLYVSDSDTLFTGAN